MNKHTHGPWFVTPIGISGWLILHNNKPLAHVNDANGNGDETEANAKLVAAAPELLECVLDAISDLSQYMPAGQLDHFKSIVNKTQ